MTTRTRTCVGVDPGGRSTGVAAVIAPKTLVYWAVVTRDADLDVYLAEICETIRIARSHLRHTARESGARTAVAVEDVVDPTPHMGTVTVRGLIDAAQVLGAVVRTFNAQRIRPASHGGGLLAAYPEALRGPREKKGTGRLRHARSAYDVAVTWLRHQPSLEKETQL